MGQPPFIPLHIGIPEDTRLVIEPHLQPGESLRDWAHRTLTAKVREYEAEAAPSEPDTREPLTSRQREMLDFIHGFREEQGMSPSYLEIGQAMGMTSRSGPVTGARALLKKGYLQEHPHTSTRALIPVNYPG